MQHMDDVATEAQAETTLSYSGPAFAGRLRAAKAGVISDVRAVPPSTSDPDRLLATLWTLHAWTTVPASYARSRAIRSSLPVRNVSAGDYKCNRFVGDAYARGANRGYGVHGAGGTYPTGQSPWYDPRDPYPPSANELASSRGATGNLTNLPITTTPQTGDIVAFPNPGGIGHTGINLGHGVYISARDSRQHPGRTTQVDDGIQITNTPTRTGAHTPRYREFQPPAPASVPASPGGVP